MSVASIIDPTTGKIYDGLIGQGGGINLNQGQIITATALTEVAFPTVPPANGSVLSYDSTTDTGLRYIANNPTALALNYQQLFSATAGNNITPVPAPAQNNYVLTSDTAPANPTGMVWKPATGGGGILQTKAPLFEDNTTTPHTIGINFSASVGEIPYGNGTAEEGALTVAPNPLSSNQYLGTVLGVPTWKDVAGSGTITATPPLVESAGVGGASNIAINFTLAGQIPYGTGAGTGALLAPAPQADCVLTSTAGGGLSWEAQGGGSSAIIFRNSQDNTQLFITKPATANDTCVITANRVQDNFNQSIYNPPLVGGFPQPTSSFQFFPWTPTNNLSITSMNVNVKLDSTSLAGTSMSVALTAYNDPTTIYSTSDPTTVSSVQVYNFTNFDSLPYEVVGGGQYSFYVLITLAPGDVYQHYYIDPQDPTSYVGNISVVGIDYPANATATFTCPPLSKFRTPLDLVGKQGATCNSYASQSFVASADAKDWIMIGAQNGGVAFLP